MRNHYVLLFLSLFLLHKQILLAQDPIFSQFSMNKLYLNPAMTGFHLGTTVNLSYRDQWRTVRKGYSQFKTNSIGISTNFPCIRSSFGLIYTDNVEGEGLLRWQNVGGSFAFSILEGETNTNSYEVKAGLRLSHSWRTLNWGNLVFADQLDPLDGVVDVSQITIPNNAMSSTQNYWDGEAGLMLSAERIELGSKEIDLMEDLQAGFSVNHLIPRNHDSFLGTPEYVPMRFTLYLSWLNTLTKQRYSENSTLWLNPIFKMDLQPASKVYNSFNYMSFNYGLGLMTSSIYGGVCVQNRQFLIDKYNTSALIVNMGLSFPIEKDLMVRFGMSKDLNVRGLSNNANGAWEFSLIVNAQKASVCDPTSPGHYRRLRNTCKRWH